MPFVKLDCGMVDSTIICEPGDAFKAWIILLLKAGPDGVAHITPQVLAMFCGCTVERMEAILTAFAGPDKSSKTKDHGGARIKITDDGYLILNYTKYRAKDYSSTERSRRFRSKCNAYATDATPLHTVSSVTGTQAEAEAEKNKNSLVKSVENLSLLVPADKQERAKPRRATALPHDFLLTQERRDYALSKGVANPEKEFEAFRAHHEAHGKVMKSWDAAWHTWCLNSKKFSGREPPRGTGSMGGVMR